MEIKLHYEVGDDIFLTDDIYRLFPGKVVRVEGDGSVWVKLPDADPMEISFNAIDLITPADALPA